MKLTFDKLTEVPHYQKILASCVTEEMVVPNTNNIKIVIHTPKSLLNTEGRTCVVYAHGGGAVSGTAEMYKPVTAGLAVETSTVVVSVDYRLAPETKCPDNVTDFYQALKFVKENCTRWKLDPERLVISGESGGGYIVFGTMVMLAQRKEAKMVKAAFPIIPMMSDYFFSDPAAMTIEERFNQESMKVMWKYIAKDLKEDWTNPLLFPSKAPDSMMKEMPPTVIFSAEFDMFITETDRMARRLRQNGRLLDLCTIPGIGHGSYLNPSLKCYKTFYDSFNLALKEYVHC